VTHILNVTDNIPNYFENDEEDGSKNKVVDIIIEMDQVEYMKISIEDKESVCIAENFPKVYDFIDGAFNEQRTK
jgi:hypothetical protein